MLDVGFRYRRGVWARNQYRVALCELNVLIAVGQRQPAFHDDRELIHSGHRRMLSARAAAPRITIRAWTSGFREHT